MSMAVDMMEIGRTIKCMEKEPYIIQTILSPIRVNGCLITSMEMEWYLMISH